MCGPHPPPTSICGRAHISPAVVNATHAITLSRHHIVSFLPPSWSHALCCMRKTAPVGPSGIVLDIQAQIHRDVFILALHTHMSPVAIMSSIVELVVISCDAGGGWWLHVWASGWVCGWLIGWVGWWVHMCTQIQSTCEELKTMAVYKITASCCCCCHGCPCSCSCRLCLTCVFHVIEIFLTLKWRPQPAGDRPICPIVKCT